jgi:DNA-binding SARP family transcriptional activator/tetratricopeptide (TPR) repeat protein
VEIRILGPMEFAAPALTVRIAGGRQRALLAALALNRGSVLPATTLAEWLWERPPATARQQVHKAVCALRHCLGTAVAAQEGAAPAPTIETSEEGYELRLRGAGLDLVHLDDRLREAAQAVASGADGTALELFRAAIRLCRGPVFAGLDSQHLRTAAARVEELRLTATERALALRLRCRDPAGALAELAELVAGHPLREAPRATLVLALQRDGRRAEALAVYEEGRRLLAAELGVEPGPELRAARDLVTGGAPTPPPRPRPVLVPQDPADQAEQPAPRRFLPRGTGDFTGRTAEVDSVMAWVAARSPAAPVVVAIGGMGGVGKTALAIHLAHLLARRYPDGQYYLDLLGFTAEHAPVQVAAALDQLLRFAGVPPDQVLPDLAGRAAQWRSTIAGKRVLLVLDNAASEEQVRPLLPGIPGALALLTSRRRLVGIEGALPVPLDVLSPEDALRLFADIAGPAGRDTRAAAAVVELCGRLPLAVRIAASRLRHRPAWTADYLAGLLRDRRRRGRLLAAGEQDVHAVIGLSRHYLEPAQRRLFGLLGLHPGPDLDAYAAAALAGVAVPVAEQALEDMVESNLVQQREPDRYLLHDLVRDNARALVESELGLDQARTALRRLLDYYLQLAHTACGPLASGPFRLDLAPREPLASLPPMGTEPEAMRVLSAELPNLLAVTAYAGTHGWSDHTWQLPCALQPFFRRMNHRERSLELFEQAVRAARGAGQRSGEVAALAGVAIVLREQGRYRRAYELFAEAIAVSRQIGDVSAEAYLRGDLGVCHLRAGELDAAFSCFGAARSVARDANDERGYATFTNNAAVVATWTGLLPEALAGFRQALAGYRATGFAEGEAITLVNIGQVYGHRGDCGHAVDYLQRGLRRSGEIGFRLGEATALGWLAAVHRWSGDLPGAVEYAERALAVARQARLPEAECVALNARGEAELAAGDVVAARRTFQTAHEIAAASQLPFGRARAREGLAHADLASGDLAAARREWEGALEHYARQMLDAKGVRRHLDALGARPVSCARCLVGGGTAAAAPAG